MCVLVFLSEVFLIFVDVMKDVDDVDDDDFGVCVSGVCELCVRCCVCVFDGVCV